MTDSTIVRGRWVVTGGGADDEALTDGAVLIEGDTIREVGAWEVLRGAHPDAAVLGSSDVAVMPGLINAHHHSNGITWAQHGVTDLLLESWLLALSATRPVDIRLNTLLSAASLLASGVTAVVDVLSSRGTAGDYGDQIERALAAHDEAGMRVALAPGIATRSHIISGAGEDQAFLARLPAAVRTDAEARLPGADAMDEDDYLAIMDGLSRATADHPRIELWYGPPGPQWVSDGFLQRIVEAAARHGVGVQTHVEESFYEKLHGPRAYGKATVLHLRDLGVLGPRFSIAHGVWLSEAEIDVMAETGAAVSHNPSSNLRLRAGIAPLNAMLDAGVNVALGMDGTTINDDEDMFAEMRLGLRLASTPRLGTPAPTPARLFEMATAGGARLLGKEGRLGRLAPGFAADLVLVDLSRITWPWVAPEADPRELLVMRARAGDVDTVIIDGEVVCRDGRPTRFDLEAVGREVAAALAAVPFPAEAAARAERLRPHVEDTYLNWEVPAPAPYTAYNARE
jgi:cytosine/adenosine deaminase-related metal-dependent hydrolase